MQDATTAELEQLKQEIQTAVIRIHTVKLLNKSGRRERDALRDGRKDAEGKTQGNPSRLEAATAKGIWGLPEWLHAAEVEFNNLMVRYTQLVAEQAIEEYKRQKITKRAERLVNTVVETTGRSKKKVNRKL